MRRWVAKKKIVSHFVEWNGLPVQSVTKAFDHAVQVAGLENDFGKVVRHTLRHTAATWLMQRGTDPWQAAGFLGMSVDVLLKTYGHHHPDYMQEAAAAITRNDRTMNVSVVNTVVDLKKRKSTREKMR